MSEHWPVPIRTDGDLIDDEIWNENVSSLNELNGRISTIEGQTLNERMNTAETDIDNAQADISSLTSTVYNDHDPRLSTAESDITALEGTVNDNHEPRITNLEQIASVLQSNDDDLDARVTELEGVPYARYELSSDVTVTANGAYNYFTFGSAVSTSPDVTTSDNENFVLTKPGLWMLTTGARTSGGNSPSGRYLMHIDADVTTYGGADSTQTGGSFTIGPYTVPVISDGTTSCKMGIYLFSGDATFSGGTIISFMYLGTLA